MLVNVCKTACPKMHLSIDLSIRIQKYFFIDYIFICIHNSFYLSSSLSLKIYLPIYIYVYSNRSIFNNLSIYNMYFNISNF